MRRAALALVLVGVALTAAGGAAGGRPSTIYVARPDPRLCPSPLCGGYWVAAANSARTRCHDGLLRPRCYVAEIRGGGAPATDALVRGALRAKDFGTVGRLGVLVADTVWAPIGRPRPSGRYFRLRDLGIRCVRAPCFSTLATRLNSIAGTTVSTVDLRAVSASDLPRVQRAIASDAGVLAQGRIEATGRGGRTFLATRFFLRVPQPRA